MVSYQSDNIRNYFIKNKIENKNILLCTRRRPETQPARRAIAIRKWASEFRFCIRANRLRGIILGGGVLLEIEALVKRSFETCKSVEGGGSSIIY